jgi:hypothetical protein
MIVSPRFIGAILAGGRECRVNEPVRNAGRMPRNPQQFREDAGAVAGAGGLRSSSYPAHSPGGAPVASIASSFVTFPREDCGTSLTKQHNLRVSFLLTSS